MTSPTSETYDFNSSEFPTDSAKYEVVTSPENISVGCVTVVKFEEASSSGFISRQQGRKHIFPDRFGTQPEVGKQYYVQINRDTQPYMRGGAFIAELLEETPGSRVASALKVKLGIDGPVEHFNNIQKSSLSNPADLNESMEKIKLRHHYAVLGRVVLLDKGINDDGTLNDSEFGVFTVSEMLDVEQRKIFAFADLSLDLEEYVESTETKAFSKKEVLVNIPPIETLPSNKHLRVLDIEVEKKNSKGLLIPSKERFRYFTLDENTLQTVYRVASAYGRRSPLFLEGDTAVSKTSSIEFFASEIEAEVRRINLSGQTDTSELIGKFVPNDGSTRIAFEGHVRGWNSENDEDRETVLEKLKERSQEILKQAFAEKRVLTKDENIEVARLEGFNISDTQWIWQDGIMPQAMKKGQILILDEATLAEPQILERINSGLEDPPSLVLTENGGVKIGPGGDFEVADGFWIVGTGNPAGYAGRTALSDAFSRRFVDYYRVPNPEEKHFKQMLELMVFGKQPDVKIGGNKYENPAQIPTEFEDLANTAEIREFIGNLSAFHMDVVIMANPKTKTIGMERHRTGGKYIFTRDTLVGIMGYISKERILDVAETKLQGTSVYIEDFALKAGRAIERFYVDPVHPDDRKPIVDAINKYNTKWLSKRS